MNLKIILTIIWLGVISLNAQERVSLTQKKPRVAVLPFDAAKVRDTQVFGKSGVDALAERRRVDNTYYLFGR